MDSTEALRRIHFWVRFWSVLSIVVFVAWVLLVGARAAVSKANENQYDRYRGQLEIR